MARATFVKSARKANPNYDIKVGDSYYWWKFRFGGKQCSKTSPTRQQLTNSAFQCSVYDVEDMLENSEITDEASFENARDEAVGMIQEMGEQSQESLDNMPEHLQESSSSGQLLQERVEGCDEWVGELENIQWDFDEDSAKDEAEEELNATTDEDEDDPTDDEVSEKVSEKREEHIEELKNEMDGICHNL